jgi:hypothetical protein
MEAPSSHGPSGYALRFYTLSIFLPHPKQLIPSVKHEVPANLTLSFAFQFQQLCMYLLAAVLFAFSPLQLAFCECGGNIRDGPRCGYSFLFPLLHQLRHGISGTPQMKDEKARLAYAVQGSSVVVELNKLNTRSINSKYTRSSRESGCRTGRRRVMERGHGKSG